MKIIAFDFDGVIVPSEQIKTDGFSLIFSEFGEDVPTSAVEESRREFADAKGNRVDIIRGIFKRLLITEGLEEKTALYVERYGKIVSERIAALSVDDAVRRTLERLALKYPLYINSNNPDTPLHDTLRTLDVEKYFKAAYGSSHTKLENLRTIAKHAGAGPRDMTFVGDGEGDRKAAEEFGCEFIGVAAEINGWKFGEEKFTVITNFDELRKLTDSI